MGTRNVSWELLKYFLYLLQVVVLSSEQLRVIGSEGPVLAPLGGTLELSCQLSPPQHAQHMEIRWFRNHYTQPVFLYRDDKDMYGEIISKYVERTELIKDAIGEGKVILRIFKVTVDDDGPYRCLFKDGEISGEHITEVKVTATSSDLQILMHPPNTKGVMLECHAGGLFPLPHMEWRDSKGEVIPATSKSHSRDGNKLFNMTIALLIETSSHRNVTCYLQNHLTHQEESICVVLSGELFSWKIVWITILSTILSVLIAFLMMSFVQQNVIHGIVRQESNKNILRKQKDTYQCDGDQSEEEVMVEAYQNNVSMQLEIDECNGHQIKEEDMVETYQNNVSKQLEIDECNGDQIKEIVLLETCQNKVSMQMEIDECNGDQIKEEVIMETYQNKVSMQLEIDECNGDQIKGIVRQESNKNILRKQKDTYQCDGDQSEEEVMVETYQNNVSMQLEIDECNGDQIKGIVRQESNKNILRKQKDTYQCDGDQSEGLVRQESNKNILRKQKDTYQCDADQSEEKVMVEICQNKVSMHIEIDECNGDQIKEEVRVEAFQNKVSMHMETDESDGHQSEEEIRLEVFQNKVSMHMETDESDGHQSEEEVREESLQNNISIYIETHECDGDQSQEKIMEELFPNKVSMHIETDECDGGQSEVLNIKSTISSSRSPLRDAVYPSSKDLGICSERFPHWLKGSMVLMISVFAIIGVMLILHLKQRVPVSDSHFELDTLWLEDISVILCVLIVFNIKLISLIYFRLEGEYDGNGGNSDDLMWSSFMWL